MLRQQEEERDNMPSQEGIKLCRALKGDVYVFVFILITLKNNLKHFMVDIGGGLDEIIHLFLFCLQWKMD